MPAGGSVQQRQGRSDFAHPGQSAVVLPHRAQEGAPPPLGEDRVCLHFCLLGFNPPGTSGQRLPRKAAPPEPPSGSLSFS